MTALVPTFRVVAAWHPFRPASVIERHVPVGMTVADAIGRVGSWIDCTEVYACVDGEPVSVERWADVTPVAGQTLVARAVPTGGVNDEHKGTLRSIAMLAAVAGGMALGGSGGFAKFFALAKGSTGAKIIAGVISAGFALGANAIIGLPDQRQLDRYDTPTIDDSNNMDPLAAVPRVYGKIKLFPPMAARPYYHADHLYMIYGLGYGRLSISDVRVDGVPISNYLTERSPGNPEGGYEIRQGYTGEAARTIAPPTVSVRTEEDVIALGQTVTWVTSACDELVVRLEAPSGFGNKQANGSWDYAGARLTIKAMVNGTGSYVTLYAAGTTIVWGRSGEYLTRDHTFNLRERFNQGSAVAYQIQIVRQSTDYIKPSTDDPGYYGTATNNTVRLKEFHHITWSDPIAQENVASIAIKVPWKGVNKEVNWDRVSCVAHSYLTRWANPSWSSALSRQPAAVFRDLICGTVNANALDSARLDLTSLQAWAAWTEPNQFYFDGVIDERMTLREALDAVCAAGFASLTWIDGKYGVIIDKAQTTVRQEFTPRNSWGFKASFTLPDPLHAIRVRYAAEDNDYQMTERWAFLTGYDLATATKTETINGFGITTAAHAEKLAWHHLNTHRHRLERCSLSCDIENLVASRGDLVAVSHDVALHGRGTGRIKTVTVDGSNNVTAITVDEQLYQDSADYAFYVRAARVASPYFAMVQTPKATYSAPAGYRTSFTFATPIAHISGVAALSVGDLFGYGELGSVYGQYLVERITAQDALSATVDLVNYTAEVYAGSSSASYQPTVTVPAQIEAMDPPPPAIISVDTDEDVLYQEPDGSLAPQIAVYLEYTAGMYAPVDHVRVEYRDHEVGGNWQPMPTVAGAPQTVYVRPVEQGLRYDVRVRTVSANNRASDWDTEDDGGDGILVVGKSTPPPDPEGLALDGNDLRWGYDFENAPIDLAGFEVRHGAGLALSWDVAQAMHPGLVGGDHYPMAGGFSGSHTFYVKAVDSAGNYSTNAASLTVSFPDPAIDNGGFQADTDYKALHWPGTKTNCYEDGSSHALVAYDRTQEMIYEPTGIIMNASGPYTDAITLVAPILTVSAASWRVEYRGHTTGWEWLPWPGVIHTGPTWVYFRLVCGGSTTTQATVSRFLVRQGAPTFSCLLAGHLGGDGGPVLFETTMKMTHITGYTFSNPTTYDGTPMEASWRFVPTLIYSSPTTAIGKVLGYFVSEETPAGDVPERIDCTITGYYSRRGPNPLPPP